jgi:hypothetical protein
VHAWSSKQTIPIWQVLDICNALIDQRTDEVAHRDRERVGHVQRYLVVDGLRRNGHTKDSALDQAVPTLEKQHAGASRRTIEDSYDRVRKDLERQSQASEFFLLAKLSPAYAIGYADAAGNAQAYAAIASLAPRAGAGPPES